MIDNREFRGSVMNREIDRLIVKYVLKEKRAQTSEAFLEGWLDQQNFYATSIEDAWKVVEYLKEYFEVKIHISEGLTSVTLIERFSDGSLKATYQGYEKSTPLAICKAALKSEGIEVSKVKRVPMTLVL